MSTIKIILYTSAGFTAGVLLGLYISKNGSTITPNTLVLKSSESQSNKKDDDVKIIEKEEKVQQSSLFNIFDEQHNKKSIENSSELFYFGPQKPIVNYIDIEEELKILNKFELIKGMRYSSAQRVIETSNPKYYLHPIYINDEPKNSLPVFDRYAIGVCVKDCKYNSITKSLSKFAIVDKVLDIGGQDNKNRGSNF